MNPKVCGYDPNPARNPSRQGKGADDSPGESLSGPVFSGTGIGKTRPRLRGGVWALSTTGWLARALRAIKDLGRRGRGCGKKTGSHKAVAPLQHRTLILHVGHGKTGSSFLQSSLALSQSLLQEEGIDYPEHIGMNEARHGRISSGNLHGDDWAKQIRLAASRSSFPTLLFSHEGLFRHLPQQKKDFLEITNEFKVRIVLFIRNPLFHMRSLYMQSVKRGGNAGSLEEYASQYQMPVLVMKFLQFITAGQTTLDVINYSNHKHELLPVFARVLGLPVHRLVVPPVANINRALTPAELEIQRLFNLHFGRGSSSFVSDAFCNELPNLPAPPFPELAEPSRELFLARMRAQIQEANAHLPEAERYQADFEVLPEGFGPSVPCENEPPLTFSRAQLEILARAISQKLKSSGVQT